VTVETEAKTLEEELTTFFAPQGTLARLLKGYEARDGQRDMALKVLHAFQENKVALIEAGTGIGKSFAYLVPAILWSQATDERLVVSTNTIALQEQLVEKDLPLILKALGVTTKTVLAKGMKNYLCLRKLQDETSTVSLVIDRETEELQRIQEWAGRTAVGSRSELDFFPLASTWEKVAVEKDACSNQQCPHFKECFFFKAKREMYDAKIIVTNHHLLFADLASRKENDNWKDVAVLPPFQRLVIDEAHHTEDVATAYFAEIVGRLQLLKVLGSLGHESDKTPKKGKLAYLKKILSDLQESFFEKKGLSKTKLLGSIDVDIAAERREAITNVNTLFDTALSFVALFPASFSGEDEGKKIADKLRIKETHTQHPFFKERLHASVEKAVKSIERLNASITGLIISCEGISNERFQETAKSAFLDLRAIQTKLTSSCQALLHFIQNVKLEERVHWIEAESYQNGVEVRFIQAEHDVSGALREHLFTKIGSTILCSATLSTAKSFEYAQKRLGLDVMLRSKTKGVDESIYESPFPYKKNALFAVPTDLVLPDDPHYLKQAAEAIYEIVIASRGGAFVLFTSYAQLKNCYEALHKRLQDKGYTILKHGDDHRSVLVRRFKNEARSVLFGTDSFWEGVDVQGQALRTVIITKLPFQVPSDPLVAARNEAIQKRGGSAFTEYSVPKAIVKFKQAFGRLIRSKEDRGVVFCLDTRLIKKQYGKEFLKSLPDCEVAFQPLQELKQKMKGFVNGA